MEDIRLHRADGRVDSHERIDRRLRLGTEGESSTGRHDQLRGHHRAVRHNRADSHAKG